MSSNAAHKPIYTLDEETDPFEYKRTPVAFACGLFDGSEFTHTWGANCVTQMREHVRSLRPGIIYIHNGGKFDLFVKDDNGECALDWLIHEKKMTIINGRIVKAHVVGCGGLHELRDSMAIMPFGLAQYDKDQMDYTKLERDVREIYRDEIVKYMRKDCTSLWELCSGFIDTFGDNLTVGGTAMKQIQKMHEFDTLTATEDAEIRNKFYYGGRVQCFEKGNLVPVTGAEFKVFDINQSYPNAMRNLDHPLSACISRDCVIDESCFFVSVFGYSYGCFPVRSKVAIEFPVGRGMYHISIHEYNAAMDTGLFDCERVIETFHFSKWGRFVEFVDAMHGARKHYQLTADQVRALLYKYVGNSGYGKFAQDPENYYDYALTDLNGDLSVLNYEPCEVLEFAGVIIWQRPSANVTRYNVATGASITGGARAALMRGIAAAKRPLYCDTDCVICEELPDVEIDPTKLGAWKLEKTGTKLSIAGKKVYALFDGLNGCVKHASKGVRIAPWEIWDAASGKQIDYFKAAPTFNFKTRKDTYIHRTVKRT